MKETINRSYAEYLKAAIKENDFWIKRSSEGTNSLMRAISNAIYFSEVHHEAIQNTVINYFLNNSDKVNFKFLQYKQPESLKLFIQNPSLPEFESVNLELVCMVYKARIKLYYLHESNLCSDIHFKKAKKTFRIFRLGDNHYAAIFDRSFKEKAILAQNIVLGIVSRALDKQPFKLQEHNSGKFVNFEYKAWQKISGHDQPTNQKRVHFNNFSFVDSILGSEKNSTVQDDNTSKSASVSRSFDYIGNEIISIFEQRKQGQQIKSVILDIEGNYDDILKSEDQNSKMKKKDDVHIFRNDLMSFSLFNEEKKPEGNGEQFYNFSTKVCGENNNLHKEVSLFKLNGIFGIGQPTGNKNSGIFGNFDPAYDDGDSLRFDNNTLDHGDFGTDMNDIKDFNDRFLIGSQDRNGISDSPEESPSHRGFGSILPNNSGFQLNVNPMKMDAFPVPSNNNFNDMASSMNSQKSSKRTLKEIYQTKKGPSQDNLLDGSSLSINEHSSNPYFKNNINVIQNSSRPAPRPSTDLSQPNAATSNPLPIASKEKYTEDIDNAMHTGTLKFFDEKNGFGFITLTNEKPDDVFVYRNEFEKAKIPIEIVRTVRTGAVLNFTFNIARYKGKGDKQSRKAVGIKLTN